MKNLVQYDFKGLLNSCKDFSKKEQVINTIENLKNSHLSDLVSSSFSTVEVKEAISNLKHGKSAGIDGLSSEHFSHAHERILVLLTLLFNAIIIHGYIPDKLMCTIIIPLVKDKKLILPAWITIDQ